MQEETLFMRLRYPKLTYAFIALIAFGIITIGVNLEYRERRTWPPSVPNQGVCIIADSRGDTQARASQIISVQRIGYSRRQTVSYLTVTIQ